VAAILRYIALASCIGTLAACRPPSPPLPPAKNDGFNLFGLDHSELQHIHTTVDLHRNVVLVRFDPLHPEAIDWVDCPIPAAYGYQRATSPRRESMSIESVEQLRARVPINWLRFVGDVGEGKRLEFDYVLTGSYELISDFKVPRDDLYCARATHYVSVLRVGAVTHGEQPLADLDACLANTAAFHDCFTPLSLMMRPLGERHWSDGSVPAEPMPSGAGLLSTDLALHADEHAWRPGTFMADALERLLIVANRIDVSTEFGFDDQGSVVVAGYLTSSKPHAFTRAFAGGKTYAVVGAGATGATLELVVRDSNDAIVAQDSEDDGNPTVTFTPPADGTYSIELRLVGQDEELGAVLVMQEGGMRIDAETLQAAFQRMLDAGSFASTKVLEMGVADGLVLHEHGWALQGTVLYPGEVVRQTGIQLASSSAVFLAVAHEDAFNIDLEVSDAQTGETQVDHEPDSNPIVLVEQPNPGTTYDLRVSYDAQGDGPTLATSLILQLSD
jgi:hypothetical protein